MRSSRGSAKRRRRPSGGVLVRTLGRPGWHDTLCGRLADLRRGPSRKRPTVILAPAVTLAGDESRLAARRELPRFVHVPRLGANTFADLAHLHAIEKQRLVGCEVSAGIDRNSDVLTSGRSRWRSAAGSAALRSWTKSPWLNPLLSVIREKYTSRVRHSVRALQDVVSSGRGRVVRSST